MIEILTYLNSYVSSLTVRKVILNENLWVKIHHELAKECDVEKWVINSYERGHFDYHGPFGVVRFECEGKND